MADDYGAAETNALADAGTMQADERKSAAYNAFAQAYGKGPAGDPDAAVKLQQYGQNEQTNPIEVQQKQANLTGTNQTNDFNALANPVKLAGLSDVNAQTEAGTAGQTQTNAFNAQLQPGKVAQQGATLDQSKAATAASNASTAQSRFSLNTQEGAQDRTSAMGVLSALSDTATNGGDIGAAYDKFAPIIDKFEGVSPDHHAALRQALIDDPQGTISKLSDAINAINLQAAGTKGAGGVLALLKFSQGQMSLKDGLNFTQQRVAAVPALTDQIAALVPKLSDVATIRKIKAEVPGTPEYQYAQLVDQLKPNLSLDDIRTLKASGTSLGRVTNQEMSMAANAVGNMDLGQSKSTLSANLGRIKNTYGVVNQNIAADISRIGPSGLPRAGSAAATPKFETGKTYTDAKGNKATWDGKTFQPVQ